MHKPLGSTHVNSQKSFPEAPAVWGGNIFHGLPPTPIQNLKGYYYVLFYSPFMKETYTK